MYLTSTKLDARVKRILTLRKLPFKTASLQGARKHFEMAQKSFFKIPDRGFPKFKDSTKLCESFSWNNQGYQLKDLNDKFKILRLIREDIKSRYPCKVNNLAILGGDKKYYVSFSVSYQVEVLKPSLLGLPLSRVVGIDFNIRNIALSNEHLQEALSKTFSTIKYNMKLKRLQRKQSRRVLKAKKSKKPLGKCFRKTRAKINNYFAKARNQKADYYHKITRENINQFDVIVTEDLAVKKMTHRGKSKQKVGLNKAILNTSFYQLRSFLEYKALVFGKWFVKVDPAYTSKRCSLCGK